MTRSLAVLLLLVRLASTASSQHPFRISEVLPDPGSGDQVVEITNVDAASQDLAGYQLCVQFSYVAFPSLVMAPGSHVRVHVGVDGTDTSTDLFTGSLFPNLGTAADGVGLYRPGGGLFFFDNPSNIVDFVQYGAGGQPRADVAVGAGIWPAEGSFAPAPVTDVSLAWDGSGDAPGDFFRDLTPTLGSPNLSPGAQNVTVGPGCNGSPTLFATSAPAFGNLDLFLAVDSDLPGMLALLFVGVGTVDVPVINPGCRFYVDTSVAFDQVFFGTDGNGDALLGPVLLEDPQLVGVELGWQAVIDNGVPFPEFAMTSGLGTTF